MPRNVSAGRNAAKPIGWRDPNAHLVRNSGALRKGQGVASGFWEGLEKYKPGRDEKGGGSRARAHVF